MRQSGKSLAAVLNWLLLLLAVLMAIGLAVLAIIFADVALGLGLVSNAQIAGASLNPAKRDELMLAMATGSLVALVGLLLALRLRRVLLKVERGEPFHGDTPRDLRMVAALLAMLTAISTAADWLITGDGRTSVRDFDIDLTSWLAVLIILLLAEVFQEGARLWADAKLTV